MLKNSSFINIARLLFKQNVLEKRNTRANTIYKLYLLLPLVVPVGILVFIQSKVLRTQIKFLKRSIYRTERCYPTMAKLSLCCQYSQRGQKFTLVYDIFGFF